jgi:hypothetical protein
MILPMFLLIESLLRRISGIPFSYTLIDTRSYKTFGDNSLHFVSHLWHDSPNLLTSAIFKNFLAAYFNVAHFGQLIKKQQRAY